MGNQWRYFSKVNHETSPKNHNTIILGKAGTHDSNLAKPLEVIETGNKLPEENVILLLRTLFQKTLEDLTKE